MTEFEIIDTACDSVNPLLLLWAIGALFKDLYYRKPTRALATFALLLGGLLLVYATMFLDKKLAIWSFFEADYSTHTAFAIAVCIAITVSVEGAAKWAAILLFVYATAMLYQGYHSLLDIVSTAILIGLPLISARRLSRMLMQSHEHRLLSGQKLPLENEP
ncbi:MAG: hypothetical protein P8166_12460 [Candidatus Thiodiazotropha sp.]